MANNCSHDWEQLKSDNDLLRWICQLCRSGPHWTIFECKNCQRQVCGHCQNR